MARCWVFLLLLGTVSGSANQYINSPPLSYDETRKIALKQYNTYSHAEFLFRQGSPYLKTPWDPRSSQIQNFSFNIQETVCKGNPETVIIESCDFKPDGVTKSCIGSYQYKYGEVKKVKIAILCRTKT